jgi:branched-chain amino acid transport system permease protein
LIMVSGYVLVVMSDLPLPLLLVVALTITVAAALVVERIAFRPVRGADPLTLLVTSFAVSYLLQSAATMAFTSIPRSTQLMRGLTTSVDVGPLSFSRLNLVILGTSLILLLALVVLLKSTTLGIQMRAAAEDFGMTRLLGVSANRVIAAAFAASGVLAGVAGILFVTQTGTVTPTLGVTPLLYAFIAAIVGGLGSMLGAALGGFCLGLIQVVGQVLLPDDLAPYRDALVFVAVLAVLVIRPQGLIVSKSQVKRV